MVTIILNIVSKYFYLFLEVLFWLFHLFYIGMLLQQNFLLLLAFSFVLSQSKNLKGIGVENGVLFSEIVDYSLSAYIIGLYNIIIMIQKIRKAVIIQRETFYSLNRKLTLESQKYITRLNKYHYFAPTNKNKMILLFENDRSDVQAKHTSVTARRYPYERIKERHVKKSYRPKNERFVQDQSFIEMIKSFFFQILLRTIFNQLQ